MRQLLLFFSLTALTSMSFAQRKAGKTQLTGQVAMPRTGRLLNFKAHAEFELAALDSVDLWPFAPKVGQQPFVDCYAYASVYSARTLLYNISHHITGQPDSTIFSPGFLQRVIFQDASVCQANGYDTYAACQVLRDTGVVFRLDFPEDCTNDTIPQALWTKALHFRVNALEIYRDCDPAQKKIEAIKSSLSQHRPVVIGWYVMDSFNKYGYGVECWQPDPDDTVINVCNDGANHAVCVIGYNNAKFGGAFQIMNSWGTDWGVGGKMWIKYADMAHFSAFGIELSNR